jgi:hypothetical protein
MYNYDVQKMSDLIYSLCLDRTRSTQDVVESLFLTLNICPTKELCESVAVIIRPYKLNPQNLFNVATIIHNILDDLNHEKASLYYDGTLPGITW